MKNKMFLIIFVVAFLGLETNAQPSIPVYKQPYKPLKEFKGDITQYFLYNIISIKDDFVGKKVNTVLDILEPDIITYLPNFSGFLATA